MAFRKWLFAGVIIFCLLILTAGALLIAATPIYLEQKLIPDLERRLGLQIESSRISFNPLQGLTFHDVHLQKQAHSISLKQLQINSPPWSWLNRNQIQFSYTIDEPQGKPLHIKGKGQWDRENKTAHLTPSFKSPSLSPLFFPLVADLRLDMKNRSYQARITSASGIELSLEATETAEGFLIESALLRFQDSLLQLKGSYPVGKPGTFYLDAPEGTIHLDQIEALLRKEIKSFSKIDPKLSRMEMGAVIDQRQFLLEDLIADYAGGWIRVSGAAGFASPSSFRLELDADQVELSQFLKGFRKDGKSLQGRMGLSANMNGYLNDRSSWKGEGDFEIREGYLWDLTVLKGLARTLHLPQLEKVRFESAFAQFYLQEETLSFSQIQLESRQMTLTGQGTLKFNGEIDLQAKVILSAQFMEALKTSPAGLIASILTTPEGESFIRVRIKGTLQKPEYSILPIPADQVFQGLFKQILK